MALKDLFREKKFGNKNTNQQMDSTLESVDTIVEINKNNLEFIPQVDYSDPSNFAKYGSAQFYYKDSIENIYKNYPYDGSKLDKQKFYNNLALYEKYIFDKEYPKSTGYIHLSQNQYIEISLSNNINIDSRKTPEGNLFDISSEKNSPLYLNKDGGNTVEFWYKEDTTVPSSNYTLFEVSGTDGQRLHILANDTLYFSYKNGNDGVTTDTAIASNSVTDWQNIRKEWHHYSFTFKSNLITNKIDVTLVIDGNDGRSEKAKIIKNSLGTSISNNFSLLGLKATIGSRVGGVLGNKTYGSFDEFRFWTSSRNLKFISLNWFCKIEGNLDSSNSIRDLGFYYKFNEGVISNSSNTVYDSIILDYSGHFLNGKIKNYNYIYSTKNTGSAFDESNFFDFEEEKDPIIFSNHTEIINLLAEKQELGYQYDTENPSQFFNLFPEWMRNDDTINNGELRNITQAISSYLDKLYLQIEHINKIKFIDYNTIDEKPFPFTKKLLEYKSIFTDELFSNATELEEIFSKNEERPLEDTLNNIKNLIYKNIYNNLTYIYKSKGTEKSYRNLFRSFGIDDEIIKFVVYANNAEIDLKETKKNFTSKKKLLVDFSKIENHNATIFQYNYNQNSSAIYGGGSGFISFLPNTFECQIIFPYIDTKKELSKWYINNVSSSLFGVHTAVSTGSNTTWDSQDRFNFQVYAVRDDYASKGVKFLLNTNGFGLGNVTLSSSYFPDVYDNTKWIFAVRIGPNIKDYSYFTSSLMNPPNYNLEFLGYQIEAGVIQNQFSASQSIVSDDARDALIMDKRIYLGSHRNNFTGSVLTQTDVKFINARYWMEYLEDETIKLHGDDFNVYAPNSSTKKSFLGFTGTEYNLETINQVDTLLLNWDFSSITGSDINGQFIVNDINLSPGVSHQLQPIKKYYYGIGYDFTQSSENMIDYNYIEIVKNDSPEKFSTSDTVKIKKDDDLFYTKDYRPVDQFINIENSMYSIISEEMMNMFSSVNDFNNLIGNPLNTHKKEYREMSFLRRIFFNKINTTPNFEKYLNLFKWLDSSINQIIKEITPASTIVPDYISTIIESHILERNKYERKLSFFQQAQNLTTYPLKGIGELKYSWIAGSAPVDGILTGKGLWLKERAERAGQYVSSSNLIIDQQRQLLLENIINDNNQKEYNLEDVSGIKYIASDYILRRASKPYSISVKLDNLQNKNRNLELLKLLKK